jgi:hypothetical protein
MTRTLPRLLLASGLCLLAAGCFSTAEQLAQRNSERCAARGHQPNTKLFNDCLAQLETERDLRTEARRREMVERSAVPSPNRGY